VSIVANTRARRITRKADVAPCCRLCARLDVRLWPQSRPQSGAKGPIKLAISPWPSVSTHHCTHHPSSVEGGRRRASNAVVGTTSRPPKWIKLTRLVDDAPNERRTSGLTLQRRTTSPYGVTAMTRRGPAGAEELSRWSVQAARDLVRAANVFRDEVREPFGHPDMPVGRVMLGLVDEVAPSQVRWA
jgi:hypothetical protein